ncbi:sterol desaturase family protein [Arachidicoccus soli]|uniref:Beta-carotene hydroxylase n=1 Tax=Arachidicoccus soli TaxID=2341117 RepID=A0A386HPF7_9BACT|nr:sterol desaturase family protein [Arachidicoccus soli]AYD47828.1 beta-carotene hydroxylase [Arachidicoccus soli]
MKTIIIDAIALIGAFIGMEGVAWLAHKYIMHGLLWRWHRDHHKKEDDGFFEHNDFFFILFAVPGILCLLFGMFNNYNFVFWIGAGITLYGLAYFIIHDIFIHQRFKILRHSDSVYFRALRRAHKMHHKHLGKFDGECFGMLWVPFKYFKEMKNKNA